MQRQPNEQVQSRTDAMPRMISARGIARAVLALGREWMMATASAGQVVAVLPCMQKYAHSSQLVARPADRCRMQPGRAI